LGKRHGGGGREEKLVVGVKKYFSGRKR